MIKFDFENITPLKIDIAFVSQWIDKVAANHGRRVGNITYLFCDDGSMIEYNRKHLNHDFYTDIITFDYSNRHRIAGDVYISVDMVRSNAELVGVEFERELLRVIIHAVLHLCGIDDKGPGEREIMEAAENDALSMYDEMINER